MDQRQVVRMLAAARVAVGVVAFVAPRHAATMLFGREADSAPLRAICRSFAARDLALGLGTLRALDQDVDAAGWARASAASDAADAVIALGSTRGSTPWRSLVGAASAAVAATAGYRASSRLG